MKSNTWTIVGLVALMACNSQASAQDGKGQEGRECTIIHQGESSRFGYCDDGSIQWTLPKDAFRIDKPLDPGPNSLVKAPERAIRENFRGLRRALGLRCPAGMAEPIAPPCHLHLFDQV